MMKIGVDRARVHVKATFRQEGSVLAQTVRGGCAGVETRLEIESQEPAERIEALLRNAENGCFVMQSLINPVPVKRVVVLNGETL